MNVQKRRTGTPEDGTTTTTIETFLEVEEEEAMAETRILSFKGMPKQPVGCFRAMQVNDLLGLSRKKMETR
jgi:hypothetical protein